MSNQSGSSSSAASSASKRQHVESGDDTPVHGAPSQVRSVGDTQDWGWYPDLLSSWVQDEEVPLLPIPGFTRVAPTLPPMPYAMERVFAAVVSRMDRELRKFQSTAADVTDLLVREVHTRDRTAALEQSLQRTDHVHDNLVDVVAELQGQVAEISATVAAQALELTQARVRIAELEEQLEPEEEPEEEEPEDVHVDIEESDGEVSGVSSQHSSV
jgi:hypothetical protein